MACRFCPPTRHGIGNGRENEPSCSGGSATQLCSGGGGDCHDEAGWPQPAPCHQTSHPLSVEHWPGMWYIIILSSLCTLCVSLSPIVPQTITVKTVDKLASVLLQLLQTSRRVTVEQEPCQGWFRPRPSHLTFHLVHTLRLLSWFKGWVWTSDVLIKAHVWPILQAWNSKKDSVPEATVMAVVRLLGNEVCLHTCSIVLHASAGFIGQPGAGSGGTSLMQLQKVLLSLLIREESKSLVFLCQWDCLFVSPQLLSLCSCVLLSLSLTFVLHLSLPRKRRWLCFGSGCEGWPVIQLGHTSLASSAPNSAQLHTTWSPVTLLITFLALLPPNNT